MVAVDYLPDSVWKPDLPQLVSAVEDINKFRSHLTYARTQRTRRWPVEAFLREIEAAFDDFLAAMDTRERDCWRAMIDNPERLPVRGAAR